MNAITVTGFEAATNTDMLNGTRLQDLPGPGHLTFELQAGDNLAANHFTASIQMPSGDTPWNAILIGAGAVAGASGVLNERDKTMATFAAISGHCVLSCIETGDTELFWRVTFTPA